MASAPWQKRHLTPPHTITLTQVVLELLNPRKFLPHAPGAHSLLGHHRAASDPGPGSSLAGGDLRQPLLDAAQHRLQEQGEPGARPRVASPSPTRPPLLAAQRAQRTSSEAARALGSGVVVPALVQAVRPPAHAPPPAAPASASAPSPPSAGTAPSGAAPLTHLTRTEVLSEPPAGDVPGGEDARAPGVGPQKEEEEEEEAGEVRVELPGPPSAHEERGSPTGGGGQGASDVEQHGGAGAGGGHPLASVQRAEHKAEEDESDVRLLWVSVSCKQPQGAAVSAALSSCGAALGAAVQALASSIVVLLAWGVSYTFPRFGAVSSVVGCGLGMCHSAPS